MIICVNVFMFVADFIFILCSQGGLVIYCKKNLNGVLSRFGISLITVLPFQVLLISKQKKRFQLSVILIMNFFFCDNPKKLARVQGLWKWVVQIFVNKFGLKIGQISLIPEIFEIISKIRKSILFSRQLFYYLQFVWIRKSQMKSVSVKYLKFRGFSNFFRKFEHDFYFLYIFSSFCSLYPFLDRQNSPFFKPTHQTADN